MYDVDEDKYKKQVEKYKKYYFSSVKDQYASSKT